MQIFLNTGMVRHPGTLASDKQNNPLAAQGYSITDWHSDHQETVSKAPSGDGFQGTAEFTWLLQISFLSIQAYN